MFNKSKDNTIDRMMESIFCNGNILINSIVAGKVQEITPKLQPHQRVSATERAAQVAMEFPTNGLPMQEA